MDILSTTASQLDVAVLLTIPCQLTRARQLDEAILPTRPYQLTRGLGPALIVSAIANQLDVSNMHVTNMHVINMHVTIMLVIIMLVICTVTAPDYTVGNLTLLKRLPVKYAPIPSPTQPGRNLFTIHTSAVFHSGKLLDQKIQGRTISVHRARLDMLLTRTVGSR